MSNKPFEEHIEDFVAAGNTVIGRPAKITGGNAIFWNGKGHILEFSDGVEIAATSFHFGNQGSIIKLNEGCRVSGKLIVLHGSYIEVGRKTIFNKACFFQAWEKTKILIGEECLFANVKARTSDTHSIISLDTKKRINKAKDIIIGNRVWIADDVDILKGATICDGSVISSRSLLTAKTIPENCLAGGVPAKVLREGITWDVNLLPVDE